MVCLYESERSPKLAARYENELHTDFFAIIDFYEVLDIDGESSGHGFISIRQTDELPFSESATVTLWPTPDE